jgi:hypothetical protein
MLTNIGQTEEADSKLDSVNDTLAEEEFLEFRQAAVDNVCGIVGYFYHIFSLNGHVYTIDM